MTLLSKIVFIIGLAVLQAAANAQTSAASGVPALKVIAPNGQTSILVGSLHIAAEGLRQPSAAVMDGARRYVVESITEPLAATSSLHDVSPEVAQGQSPISNWALELTKAQLLMLKLNVVCNFADMRVEPDVVLWALLTRKSAADASQIAIRPCSAPGLLSRDDLLARAAGARGLSPSPLEVQAEVESRREAVPERIYRYQLVRAFTPESSEGLRRVVNALNTGDYERVAVVLRDLSANDSDFEVVNKLMVADRNLAWMPTLERYLDEGRAIINVGSAHLPGPAGLLALLGARGYQVEPIHLPEDLAHSPNHPTPGKSSPTD
jgi:hypothetical protein